MKINEKNNKVTTIGLEGEKQFKVNISTKAIDILTNALYSDKINSIIRELSCNAYDSHVQAGKKEVSFNITMPTNVYPYFIIEDFGIGLSEENVEGIYINYFCSTKTQTNEQTGCFGLGSKTPFSYTDNYMIESIYEGVLKKYLLFINQTGVPSIKKVYEEKTFKCNGIKITIPVKKEDINEWNEKIQNVVKSFEIKPKVFIGNTEIEYEFKNIFENINEKPLDFIKFSDEKLNIDLYLKYKSPQEEKHNIIIQGNISYKFNNIDNYMPNINRIIKVNNYNYYTHVNLILKVPIGTFNVTASREDIHYDEYTINNLKNIDIELYSIIQKNMFHVFNETTDYIEKLKYMSLCYNDTNLMYIYKDINNEWNSLYQTKTSNNKSVYVLKSYRDNEEHLTFRLKYYCSLLEVPLKIEKALIVKDCYIKESKKNLLMNYIKTNIPNNDIISFRQKTKSIYNNYECSNISIDNLPVDIIVPNNLNDYNDIINFLNKLGVPYTNLSSILNEIPCSYYKKTKKLKNKTIEEEIKIKGEGYDTRRIRNINLKEGPIYYFLKDRHVYSYLHDYNDFINFLNIPHSKLYQIKETELNKEQKQLMKKELKKGNIINIMNLKNVKCLNNYFKYILNNNLNSNISYMINDSDERFLYKNLKLIKNTKDINILKKYFIIKYTETSPYNSDLYKQYPKFQQAINKELNHIQQTTLMKYKNKVNCLNTNKLNEKIFKIILNS